MIIYVRRMEVEKPISSAPVKPPKTCLSQIWRNIEKWLDIGNQNSHKRIFTDQILPVQGTQCLLTGCYEILLFCPCVIQYLTALANHLRVRGGGGEQDQEKEKL